jgi:hypothetical protein
MADLQQRLDAPIIDLTAARTVSQVATILRTEGITGRPGNCASCPIALLVSKRLGGLPVKVRLGEIEAYASLDDNTPSAVVWQPDAVGEFIELFDRSFTPDNLLDLVAQK